MPLACIAVCLDRGGDHLAYGVVLSEVFLGCLSDFAGELPLVEELLECGHNAYLIVRVEYYDYGGGSVGEKIVDSALGGGDGGSNAHRFEEKGIESCARPRLNEDVACGEDGAVGRHWWDDGDHLVQVEGCEQLSQLALAGSAAHYQDHKLVFIEHHVANCAEEILEVVDIIERIDEHDRGDAVGGGVTAAFFGDESADIDLLDPLGKAGLELGKISGDGSCGHDNGGTVVG